MSARPYRTSGLLQCLSLDKTVSCLGGATYYPELRVRRLMTGGVMPKGRTRRVVFVCALREGGNGRTPLRTINTLKITVHTR